ncbi:MAG: hypothetical protein ACOXZW_03855 [Bacilli bacterium]|jgi:hypothetical protein
MITELNRYRDSNGYINIDDFIGWKENDNILNDHYFEIYMMKLVWTKLLPSAFRVNLKKKLGVDRQHKMLSIDNIDFFYKLPSRLIAYSPIMESIASVIGNYLNGRYLDYEVVVKENRPFGSISKSFLTEDTKFHTFASIAKNNRFNSLTLNNVLALIEPLHIDKRAEYSILKVVLEMIVIDSFCGQFDRHNSNSGILEIQNKGKRQYEIAPVFDNEMWFPNGITNEEIKKYSNFKETELILKYYNFCKKIKSSKHANIINDYNVYEIIKAMEYNEIDYINGIPNIIRDVVNDFDKDLLKRIYYFNPQIIINQIPYPEVKNNEIYGLLIQRNRENFINEIERTPRMKKLQC